MGMESSQTGQIEIPHTLEIPVKISEIPVNICTYHLPGLNETVSWNVKYLRHVVVSVS